MNKDNYKCNLREIRLKEFMIDSKSEFARMIEVSNELDTFFDMFLDRVFFVALSSAFTNLELK